MFNSLTKYLFSAPKTKEAVVKKETEAVKYDVPNERDGWVFIEKPSEYYGDYEDNTEDDDNDREYSPMRSLNLKQENSGSYRPYGTLALPGPQSPRRMGSPKVNNHLSRSRRMSSGSIQVSLTRSGEGLDLRDCLSSDEQQQQHSDFERYRGPYWNLLEDEEHGMMREGGVLSSASSQPELINIPSHEEHWILSPAPCFLGKPEVCLKGSMEDLLIERPTTSIYLKFIGKKNQDQPIGSDKNGLNTKDVSPQAGKSGLVAEKSDVTASGFFHGLLEKNGFDSFDSRLVTFDTVYPQNQKTLRPKLDLKENDGWSSESSTRDHSLSRPPIRSYTARNRHPNLHQPRPGMADESSEIVEDMPHVGYDPNEDMCTSKFLLPFEDDEMRGRSKRKLLPKHQRSHTRTKIWQKPRKSSAAINLINGCK